MKAAEIERRFAELDFDCDERRPPDDARRAQFRAGWEDATVRRRTYSTSSLRHLTWRNLGYRFGEAEGRQAVETIEAVYDVLAQRYETLWVPRSIEDHLLFAYWRRVGGRIYAEVPLGGPGGPGKWPSGCTRRRLDGVRFVGASDPAIVRYSAGEFRQWVSDADTELIEVKRWLNRLVIGQIIAGRDMFGREYGTDARRSVIICAESDTALEWVCQRHEIFVQIQADAIPPNHPQQRPGRAVR